MRHTDTPGTRPFLPHPHTSNYQQFTEGGPLVDTTLPYRPFDSGADGSMTGTARDLNRFFAALARGQLLRPTELGAMRDTVGVPHGSGHPEGSRAGLGLSSRLSPVAAATWDTAGAASGTSSRPRPPSTAGSPSPSPRTAAPPIRKPRLARKRPSGTSSTAP
ncbi:hypothetical protein AB0N26_26125 [Streptomyces cellulosae]